MVKKKSGNITIDGLARMVARGFEETKNGLDNVKNDLDDLQGEVHGIKMTVDRIEKMILADHQDRIDRPEDQIKELQTDFRQLVGFKK